MFRRLLAAFLWAAIALPAAAAPPAMVATVLTAQADPCPGAILCGDFTKSTFKGFGVITSAFQALPNLTVTRASFAYGENADGSLKPFQAGQARITSKGLGRFEATTNGVVWSEDLSNVQWSKTDYTLTANALAAPNSAVNGALITAGSAGTDALVSPTVTISASATETGHWYLAYKNTRYVRVIYGDTTGTDGFNQWLDLQSCTAGTHTNRGAGAWANAHATMVAGGWCNIDFTGVASTRTSVNLTLVSAAADGSTTRVNGAAYYAWGADLRAGAYPVPYCPTGASTAVCAADNVAITGLNLPVPFSITARAIPTNTGVASTLLTAGDAGGANQIKLVRETNNQGYAYGVSGASTVATFSTPNGVFPSGSTMAGALSCVGGSYNASYAGVPFSAVSAACPAAAATRLDLGGISGGGAFPLNGYLQSFAVTPVALTAAQEQAATSAIDTASLSLNFAAGLYKTTTPYVRTNYVPNNSSATGWVGTTGNGITWASTGSGVEFGMPYVEWRISGTATGTGILNFQAVPSTAIAAANGQSWVHSSSLRLVAGSFAGLTALTQNTALYSSVPAYISEIATPISVLGMGSAAPTPYFVAGTAANASTAAVLPYWQASFNIGAVINATIRVYADQIEQGRLYPSSWIATNGAAASVATTQSTNPADVGNLSYTGPAGYAPDCNGNLVSFAANVPRITCAGVLIEQAATNLALWSQDFSNAAWSTFGGATKVGMAPVTDPAGGNTAYEIAFGPTGGTIANASAVYQTGTVNSGVAYTHTLYVRAKTGTTTVRIYQDNGVGAQGTADTTVASTAWTRIPLTVTGAANAAATWGIRNNVAGNSGNVYVAFDMREAGAFATSFIATTSATVTRPADVMSYGGLSAILAQPITIGVDWTKAANFSATTGVAAVAVAASPTANSADLFQTSQTNVTVQITTGGSIVKTDGFTVALGRYMAASRLATDNVNSAVLGTIGTSSGALALAAYDRLSVGSNRDLTLPCNCNVASERIYPYGVNDNELAYRSAGNF